MDEKISFIIGKESLGGCFGRWERWEEKYMTKTYKELKWVYRFPTPGVFNGQMLEPQQNLEIKPTLRLIHGRKQT